MGRSERLEKLEEQWNKVHFCRKRDWNESADMWDKKYSQGGKKAEESMRRVNDTVKFLESRGALTGESRVLDAGCGPGRFAAKFAEKCVSVTGVDISEKMCRYGREYCEGLGLGNVDFIVSDFSKADIDELGLRGKFDLAFSSITPAVNGTRGLDNLIASSRNWCFNASFVREDISIVSLLKEEIFGIGPGGERPARAEWFHLMFNVLWERGYDPEVSYYDRHKEIRQEINDDLVRWYMENCIGSDKGSSEEERKVRRFLEERAEEDGLITETSDYRTAWMLWNVNDAR